MTVHLFLETKSDGASLWGKKLELLMVQLCWEITADSATT